LGSYEYEKQKLFEKVIKKGSVVLDIGAHVGYYSLLAAVLVGRDGLVYAFEPIPRNLNFLKRHSEMNKFNNIKILDIAVSDHQGMIHFEEGSHSTMGHISSSGKIQVATNSLDNLVSQKTIIAPDFIKIDVEGAELSVLQGGKELLVEKQPTIFLATHGPDIHRQCCDFLASLGYTLSLIGNYDDEILAYV
jgi:FkbM family methyltransferase